MTTDRPTDLSFGKFEMAISHQPVIRSTSCLVLIQGGAFGVGGSNGAISVFIKSKMAAIFENSNGDISAMGHLIHTMFVSRVGFSESASRVLLFPVELNPRDGCRPSKKLSNKYVSGRNREQLCRNMGHNKCARTNCDQSNHNLDCDQTNHNLNYFL